MMPTSWTFFLALCATNIAHASSPLAAMWRNLTFENETGDVVTMKVQNEVLIQVDVTLKGHRIALPRKALEGISAPVLHEANLYYESGFVGGRIMRSVVLEVPAFGSKVDDQDATSPSRHFQFVFRNGELSERILQVDKGTFWDAVEVKRYGRIEEDLTENDDVQGGQ